MTSHPLLIETQSEHFDAWRWMIGADIAPVAASLSGDLFFADHDGRVHWIDTGAGSVQTVAESRGHFAEKLRDAEFRGEYLLETIVEDFLHRTGPLPPGRCLGYRTLPVFGGSYDVENRVAIDCREHFRFTGDVHRQIDGLPDGATVQLAIK